MNYDELVKDLRYCGDAEKSCFQCKFRDTYCFQTLANQAADAIEELAAFREQITDGHMYIMRDGVLYEAKIELPKGNKIVLPPIEIPTPPKEDEA